ncbi:MAG: hypothetical protein NWE76_00635 [Candidatus Bathyarchaeota archaeon]|nr:hypothetical protein [Candidatus Bathyarchaeota archaeon]
MEIQEKKIDGLNVKLIQLNNVIVGIATDVGPRILYLASGGRSEFNLFSVLPEAAMQTTEGFWRIYGGHRFWSSPEAMPRSYSVDDKPVKIGVKENSLTVYGNPEVENSVQKEITIEPSPGNGIRVVHTIENIGRWPIKLGCWALSVMRQEGFAIIPLKPSKVDEGGLLPDRHVSLWPYTDLTDERLALGKGYVFVRQNPKIQNPFKIGAMANPTWTAYWVDGIVFVKQFTQEGGEYPDFGCSVEAYTNADMLELETLSPLRTVGPSERIQHTEIWKIFDVGELTPEAEKIKDKLEDLLSD